MKQFFDEVSNLRGAVNTIKKYITDIEETHQKALTAVSEEQGQDHAKAIDGFMDQVNMQSGVIRKKLKEMEAANKDFESKNPNSSDARIRVSQHAVLVKKFTDTMTEYNEIQTKYKGKYKQRLQKQYLIVKPDATPEEVEKVVSGEGGAAIFAQQIMPGAQYMEAKQALQDIQERHQDIVKIEKSILELQQLFIDMSVLVAQQGELLNQIDSHVTKAVEYTEQGVEEMKQANKIQKRSRKRMCILIFCLVILAVCVGLGLGLTNIFRR
ncbi:t-SNARE [Catenaria anguillulae PL171]|uniref:t-SNARE n=1 Tax=Catenaria anguillulae PL171 TaxID=765915 RepID=A0A1Y2I346_9FUNG|nr:t-SNARE [Catenaria anguillulae PL171]